MSLSTPIKIISKVPVAEEIQFLDDKIYEYNSKQTNQHNGKLFSKWALNSDGVIIGGLTGWSWAEACEITLFWLDESYRHLGYGTELLHAAEEYALKEGCKIIFLRSYSFQAPAFYIKNGFKIEHTIQGFPPGYLSFFLVKNIG